MKVRETAKDCEGKRETERGKKWERNRKRAKMRVKGRRQTHGKRGSEKRERDRENRRGQLWRLKWAKPSALTCFVSVEDASGVCTGLSLCGCRQICARAYAGMCESASLLSFSPVRCLLQTDWVMRTEPSFTREREKKENKLSLPNVPCLFKQEIITRELAGDVVYQYARLGARTMMTIVLWVYVTASCWTDSGFGAVRTGPCSSSSSETLPSCGRRAELQPHPNLVTQ